MKKSFFSCLCMVILSTNLVAQDFNEDYKKVQRKYAQLNNFYCEIRVSMFEHADSPEPEEIMMTLLKKKGDEYLYETKENIFLTNERCILNVDKQQKRLIYTVKEKRKESAAPDKSLTAMMDSLLKKNDSVIYEGMSQGRKKYVVYAYSSSIIRSEIYIDDQMQLCSRLVYHYKPGKLNNSEKVIIDYEKINTSPVFTQEDFSEKKYAVYNGKVLKSTRAYADYKTTVIDPENKE